MNDSVRESASLDGDGPVAHAPQTAQEAPSALSAGDMLRTARESAGLHIASLAAALKVPVRKLEALEGNRWEELTDATFSRALASSVARHLKLDPAQVLAALPAGKPVPLVISDGLGKAAPAHGGGPAFPSPTVRWVVGLLMVAAVGLYLAPQLLPTGSPDLLSPGAPSGELARSLPDTGAALGTAVSDGSVAGSAVTPAANGDAVAAAGAVTPTGVTPPVADGPADSTVSGANAVPVAVAVSPNPAVAGKVLMGVVAKGDTWLEVRDDTGRLRVQRLVKAGEQMTFEEGTVYSVVVGNAAATEVEVRGKPMDLLALTKNNVARFEVK